jgi:hypothetical protein
LLGLAVGILGLVVQWIADPDVFHGFPPGIAFIAACAVLVVVASGRWWAPVFSVLISLWIVFGRDGGRQADPQPPLRQCGDRGGQRSDVPRAAAGRGQRDRWDGGRRAAARHSTTR